LTIMISGAYMWGWANPATWTQQQMDLLNPAFLTLALHLSLSLCVGVGIQVGVFVRVATKESHGWHRVENYKQHSCKQNYEFSHIQSPS